MQDVKYTPLYETHLRRGGKMVEFGGWALPVQYEGILAEHKAVRERCGLFDVSHMGELLLEGDASLAYLNHLLTNDFTGMEVGRCRYSPMCYPDGGTVDDLIVYKMKENKYLIIVNASNCEKDYGWMREQLGAFEGLSLLNISADMAQVALQGPKFREVLAGVGMDMELPAKPYAFVENATVGGVPNCLVSTTGYTGEPGVEIYLAPSDAGRLFDALVEAGATPCGLGARDTLRFEASMPLYGHELDKDISPLEAGLKSFVKLGKPDFIGKAALSEPPTRRRIGLELMDRGIAREHCPVLDAEGREVGHTTSGGAAPTLGKNMAMAIVTNEAADLEELFIEVRGRRLRAARIKMPFYKTINK